MASYVNIHTHHPTGHGVELRTAGVHPWDADTQDITTLLPLPEGVQALGEMGLDFACDADRARQTELFRAQLALACKIGLPVVLHCVRAFEPVMRELRACTPRAVIFHGFIGSPEQARQALQSGYYLSFGMRTFGSPKTIEALRTTPLERLFFETDDDPTPIETVYARAAETIGIGVEELLGATNENYERIFATHHG